jgi:hypothetical protein
MAIAQTSNSNLAGKRTILIKAKNTAHGQRIVVVARPFNALLARRLIQNPKFVLLKKELVLSTAIHTPLTAITRRVLTNVMSRGVTKMPPMPLPMRYAIWIVKGILLEPPIVYLVTTCAKAYPKRKIA